MPTSVPPHTLAKIQDPHKHLHCSWKNCEYQAKSEWGLLMHYSTTHEKVGESPTARYQRAKGTPHRKGSGKYACEKCDRRFDNELGLSIHTTRMHSERGNWSTYPKGRRKPLTVIPPTNGDVPENIEQQLRTHPSPPSHENLQFCPRCCLDLRPIKMAMDYSSKGR